MLASLLLVLLDDTVYECHAIGIVEFLFRVAGTLFHTGEVHVDDAHRTFVAGEPVGCWPAVRDLMS